MSRQIETSSDPPSTSQVPAPLLGPSQCVRDDDLLAAGPLRRHRSTLPLAIASSSGSGSQMVPISNTRSASASRSSSLSILAPSRSANGISRAENAAEARARCAALSGIPHASCSHSFDDWSTSARTLCVERADAHRQLPAVRGRLDTRRKEDVQQVAEALLQPPNTTADHPSREGERLADRWW